jgi:hypothetical protein
MNKLPDFIETVTINAIEQRRVPLHFSLYFQTVFLLNILQYHPAICTCVARVLSFLQDFSLQFCVHFSSLCVVRASARSVFCRSGGIW